ncbi:hypothetical protein K2X85_05375 [bacterium]|nr:hypothetical protein [bacterium]
MKFYPYRIPERTIKVVAVEPATSGHKKQAFCSTAADAAMRDLLTKRARRSAIEPMFRDSENHLGFEDPQDWCPLSDSRSTANVDLRLDQLFKGRPDHADQNHGPTIS